MPVCASFSDGAVLWRTSFISTISAPVKIMGCAASKADPASLEKALRDAMRPFDGTWTDSDVATLQTAIAQAEAAFPPEGSSLQATLNEAKEILRSAVLRSPAFDRFLKKVGLSVNQLIEATKLLCEGKKINDSDCNVIPQLIDSGALAQLNYLNLEVNQIGDSGVKALAGAVSSGALARLTHLNLRNNEIGDSGVKALADAVSSVASAETVAPRLPGWTSCGRGRTLPERWTS